MEPKRCKNRKKRILTFNTAANLGVFFDEIETKDLDLSAISFERTNAWSGRIQISTTSHGAWIQIDLQIQRERDRFDSNWKWFQIVANLLVPRTQSSETTSDEREKFEHHWEGHTCSIIVAEWISRLGET